ncbi:hypothetical protein H0H92_002403 [Tricholoma furcatifolium]|nr:hypothetical protein H0H92_002403 [Tricholoma furcatifolium]
MASSALVSLRAQKKSLRKAISATLKSLPAAAIEEQSTEDHKDLSSLSFAARAVTARVLSLPAFQNSQSICCYLSMPSGELDTSILVSEILRQGKTLFVPKVDPSKDGHMDFLKVYGIEDLNSFPSGLWGIKEPGYSWQGLPRTNALDATANNLDIILVPGLGFDRSHSRLGHGKGYYDRFIASFSTTTGRPRPLLVALALREQLLEASTVPVGIHDEKMDLIATPDEILSNEF